MSNYRNKWYDGKTDLELYPPLPNTQKPITETDALHDLAPVALDLIVKWAQADKAVTLAQNQEQMDAAFIEKRAIQGSIRVLAVEIEARRLAETV